MSGQSSSGASVGPPLVLEILAGPDAGRRQPLPDGGLVLGRGEDADLRLTDEMISRRHVWVERAAGGARVVDLGSANGLWIGGERQSEAALADGGTFRIGASTICVLADAPVRAEPASPKPAAQKPAAPERTSSESAESQSAVLGPAAPASARPEPPASGPVAPQPGPSEPTPPEPAAGQLIRPEPVVGESRAPEPPGNDSVPIGETRTAESEEDPDDDVEQHELSPGLAHLASLGTPREASGNAPFLLDDPEAMWLVEAGRVEIFAVGVEAGRPVGARSHYLTVEPGEAFFGMDFGSYRVGAGFLAVGRRGTRLRTVPRGALRSVAAGADSDSGKNSLASPAGDPAAALGGLVDGWVEGMTRRLSRDMLRPLVDVSLVPGEPVEVERDQKARPLRGVTWLDVPTGQLLWVGLEELEPTSAFPLTSDAWAEGTEELGPTTPVEPRLVGEALADGSLWAGLDLFHQLLCRCEFVNKKLAKVDDLARLRSKADDARQAREAALDDLASVLRPDDDDAAIVGDSTVDDPIFRALVRVGAAQDIQVRPHPDDVSDRLPEDRVAVYAKASGVRARKVALRGRWWREDNGPILARLEDAETPVALVPRGARAYDLIDPRDGSRTTVDAKVADGLDGFGWVLYRTLPEGTIGIKKLLGFGARGLRRDFTTLGVMGIVVGLLGALTPFFTGQIFDNAIPEAERGQLAQFAAALIVAALVTAAYKLVQSIAVLRIQGKMDYAVQSAVWDRLLDLPSGFFRDYAAGDLANRAAGVNAIRGLLSGAGVAAVLGAFSSLFYFALMFYYSVPLALLAVFLTIIFVSFTTLANHTQLRHQRRLFELQGTISGLVLQLISGVSKLRVSGSEDHAFRVWAERFSEQRRVAFTVGRIQNAVATWNAGFPVFSSIAIFYLVASSQEKALASGGTGLTTGEFIAFSAAYALFLTAMQSLATASLELLEAVPLYERLAPILDTEPEVDASKAYPGKLKGEIELSHLHFRYQDDGPWIIKDVSLRIRPGEFVAFVGASGSGKSTLMRLMLGFERPAKGSIYYDGLDLGHLDLREVRQQLGVVLQESKVLPADVFRNIVGTTSRTLEEAWDAARMAGLEEDIRNMPMGMHTYVSEGGGGFSGGQRQRLLIARAVVNKPRILFMDEATSALDNRNQAIVTESLDRLHATRIVIAHRLTTVIGADTICYLEGGEIVEQGTYEELMRLDGRFARLARRQIA